MPTILGCTGVKEGWLWEVSPANEIYTVKTSSALGCLLRPGDQLTVNPGLCSPWTANMWVFHLLSIICCIRVYYASLDSRQVGKSEPWACFTGIISFSRTPFCKETHESLPSVTMREPVVHFQYCKIIFWQALVLSAQECRCSILGGSLNDAFVYPSQFAPQDAGPSNRWPLRILSPHQLGKETGSHKYFLRKCPPYLRNRQHSSFWSRVDSLIRQEWTARPNTPPL